jgi:hypothetical protein
VGDDSVRNALILTVDGRFELKTIPPFQPLANDPSIVDRHESFPALGGYVGPKAAADEEHVTEYYVSSMEQWVEHLKNHETEEYTDTPPRSSIEAVNHELRNLRSNWRPDY